MEPERRARVSACDTPSQSPPGAGCGPDTPRPPAPSSSASRCSRPRQAPSGRPVDFVPDKAEAGDGFGSQLAVFDHDQDGCSDLAVGVPFEDVGMVADAGAVTVLYGSRNGLGQGRAAVHLQQGSGTGALKDRPSTVGDLMGAALAAGTTADDQPYLVIGAPGKNLKGHVNAGLIYYLRGDTSVSVHEDSPGVQGVIGDNHRFGSAVAGSPNHIAVGTPGEVLNNSADVGMVQIMKHQLSTDGVPAPVAGVTQDTDGISDAAEGGDQFGASLAMVPYRPSGAVAATDSILAVGSPGETLWVGTTSFPEAGMVHTLRVTASGTVRTNAMGGTGDTVLTHQPGLNGLPLTGKAFGMAIR
ncbi:FG-GAP repeat protein [Streptomyces sp. NPDC087437]|uniref:FG-GAP repeat protein n=1 Tax=Streptomyces sp. NPDC087437 TaxID=3365789 RepID=UPI0037FF9E39